MAWASTEMLVSLGLAGNVSDQREKSKLGENLETDLSELGTNEALLNPTQPWTLSSLS